MSDAQYVSGNTYAFGSDVAIRILMFAMVFSFLNSLFGFTLVVLNRQMKLMWINLAALAFNLLVNLMVIPLWGFRGAATITVISEFLILIMAYTSVHRALQFHISSTGFFKILISSLMMGAAVYGGFVWLKDVSYLVQLAILVPLGIVVYILAMFKTNAITPEMMALLKKR